MGVIYGAAKDFIFQGALAFLKKKKPVTQEIYKRLDEQSRAKAFTVSGYSSLEILNTFLDALEKAVEEGTTKDAFRKTMNHFLQDNGYEAMNPWKSDTIFRTNVQTAYNVGHYESMTDSTVMQLRPYWQYKTAGDGDVRDAHAAMHGRVFRADDPVWDVWYPPNGFRCRCIVVSLSKNQVEQRKLQVEKKAPYNVDLETGEILPVFPDKGFSNNPAKKEWKPDMKGIRPELKGIFKRRQQKE